MIVNSLLDTDQYKFSMAQVALHQYPAVMVRYAFKCRNGVDLSPYVEEIREEVAHLCTLRFTSDELKYLASIPFLKPDFIEYLRLLQLNPDYIEVYNRITPHEKELMINIHGPWISTIWFEVPVLDIVSEVCARHQDINVRLGIERLLAKIEYLNNLGHEYDNFRFADFGTRRRFSHRWQEYVIGTLLSRLRRPMLIGTSNVYFAKKYGIKPIGTMAHEYIMAHQQLVRLKDSQKVALQAWADEYRGELGIALSDTVGMDAFLKDFDLYFSKLFDGARQDSGNPYVWCDKLIDHYIDMKIDNLTKTAIFSDGLDFEKATGLFKTYSGIIRTSFGIGTNLTNDMYYASDGTKFKNPNIVIKMVECNGGPVAKISDSKGKGMCEDPKFVSLVKRTYGIRKE